MWIADQGYFRTEGRRIPARKPAFDGGPHVPRRNAGADREERFFSQGRIPLRRGTERYICPAGQALTPIREGKSCAISRRSTTATPKPAAHCPLPHTMYERRPLVSRIDNEDALDRTGAAPGAARTRHSRLPSRDRRASFRQHQAMDESGRLPHATPSKRCAPSSALRRSSTSATGAQHPWHRKS